MNKVILVGRLTKDPEIYYSKGENATALHDIILQLIGRFVVKVNLPLILFLVFFLDVLQNLHKNISEKECGLLFPDVFKQEVILIKMG